MILQQDFIKSIITDFEKAEQEAKDILEKYTDDQLTRTPDSGGWSAAQCFGHLAKMNKLYEGKLLPTLDHHKNSKRDIREADQLPIKHSLTGKFFMMSLKPGSKIKVPAPKSFKPADDASRAAIESFLTEQAKLNVILESLKTYPISQIKISTPVSSLIKLRLCDAFQMIAWHNLRHVEQAKRAMGI